MTDLRRLDRANCCGIIMSWAAPGQGGHGHVNEQWASTYVPKVEALGYRLNRPLTELLRRNAALMWFSYRQNCSRALPRLPRWLLPNCAAMGDQLVAFDRLPRRRTMISHPEEGIDRCTASRATCQRSALHAVGYVL